MTAYYNECDPFAAQWLRNLIANGHIAPGEVDERSIKEVTPDDLRNFDQCHFFAGIGVWSHALRRAGWSDDTPVWTGSCPCQPFSAAGKKGGFDDDRHLWPVWFDLIRECHPPVILGEQVASALGWFDLVSADLEGADYACGASDLCAAGFSGAHIRQRLFFVGMAHPDDTRLEGWRRVCERSGQLSAGPNGLDGRLEHSNRSGRVAGIGDDTPPGHRTSSSATCGAGGLADCRAVGRREERPDAGGGPVGDRTQGWPSGPGASCGCGRTHAPLLGRDPADWLFCRDGKWRPVGPGTFPLADAATQRVGRLRAYGNALDAETAAQFCGAVMELSS